MDGVLRLHICNTSMYSHNAMSGPLLWRSLIFRLSFSRLKLVFSQCSYSHGLSISGAFQPSRIPACMITRGIHEDRLVRRS